MNPPDESVTKPLRRTFTLMENEAVQAKEAFLAQEYGKGKDHWQRLLSFVKTECEDHLHVKDVQATYSCRVKDQESMRKKIEKRQSHGQCQTLSHIYAHPGHWDFAGMRLCLYFPDQRRDVERFINTHEPFVPLPVREFDERIRLSTQEARIYQERMGLYNAQHYWLQLKKDHPSVQQHVPGYTDEKVEIQVRSVLMDAWAEVRHDFDYKVMNGYPSEDELRILDAIKGNIASCEILLDHLRNVRQERVTVDEQRFDKKKKLFWQEVICSLRPYHKLLLQVLDDGDSWSHEMLQSIFRDLKIYTPADLKGRMGSLNSPMDQQYEINRAHEAFALVSTQYSEANKPRMYTYFGDHGADARDDYSGPKHFQTSLSSFIAAYLFHKLPTTKLENICHGEILTYLKRRPCDVNGDHRAYCSLTTSAPECDLIWMRITCTIMSSLQKRAKNCKEDFPHRCYRIRAFSIAWHVHEWASIHCYDDQVKKHKEELQVTPMIVRMIEYFRKFQDSNADDNTAWVCE
jgi:ppGpp synthetase/RelA/SpoT-type nucleotidyltranferase